MSHEELFGRQLNTTEMWAESPLKWLQRLQQVNAEIEIFTSLR